MLAKCGQIFINKFLIFVFLVFGLASIWYRGGLFKYVYHFLVTYINCATSTCGMTYNGCKHGRHVSVWLTNIFKICYLLMQKCWKYLAVSLYFNCLSVYSSFPVSHFYVWNRTFLGTNILLSLIYMPPNKQTMLNRERKDGVRLWS